MYISNKRHLVPFKILYNGGNALVQYFSPPPCEASLELLKFDDVECLLRSCFHHLHGGKSLSFQRFISLSGIKRNHRGLGPVNRVGGERRFIPERPNTGPQTELCELGRRHDGETNHPISKFPGVFSANYLSVASKLPSKTPDRQSVHQERISGARFLEHRGEKRETIRIVFIFDLT